MDVFQYVICFIIILVLPPVTWIYSLINWILGGYKLTLFKLKDVAICECDDNDVDFAILQQMLDNFRLNTKSEI